MAAQDTTSLAHDCFHDVPVAMLAIDDSGRIRWVNQALENTIGLSADQLLGHTVHSLPSPAHRVLLDGAGLVQLYGPGVPERWLRVTVSEGRGVDGVELQLRCYQDITEQRRLERDNLRLQEAIEELRLNDPLTGLSNERAISQVLNQQVSRSRRYNNPLSLLLVQMTDSDNADAAVQALARLLRDRMRWVDQVGRWRDDTFLAVLPETTDKDARLLADKIHAGLQEAGWDDSHPLAGLAVHFGIAAWQKGDDARTLLRRATQGIGTMEQTGNG